MIKKKNFQLNDFDLIYIGILDYTRYKRLKVVIVLPYSFYHYLCNTLNDLLDHKLLCLYRLIMIYIFLQMAVYHYNELHYPNKTKKI